MEKVLALCAALAVLSFQPDLAHSQANREIHVRAVPDGPTERIYVHTTGVAETMQLRDALSAAGALRINCFLPDVIVCDLPLGTSVPELGRARLMDDLRASAAANGAPNLRWARDAYSTAFRRQAASSIGPAFVTGEADACLVKEIPRPVVERTQLVAASRPEGRNIHQNSEIMVGDIVVHLIFPESDSGPGHTENWSDAAIASAATDAAASLIFYQIQFPRTDINFIIQTVERATTATEPIQMTLEDERFWVSDVLDRMGYEDVPDNYLEQVHAFNEDKRRQFGADWAFSTFIVNSENDFDHRFDGAPRNAWAYLGGPHFVLPHPVGAPREGVAPPNFEQNFMHLIGHMFWGLDEHHRVLSLSCTSRSGYLNYQHGNYELSKTNNAQSCFAEREFCIMNLDDAVLRFYNGEFCEYSSGMFGLADNNANGVPDAIDSPPILEFETTGIDTVTERTATLRFRAVSIGVNNLNSRQVASERVNYLLPVKLVARSQNGVIAEQLTPLDGDYDGEFEEDFDYTVTALQSGMNTLKFITRNSAGATSVEYTKRVFYLGLTFLHFEFSGDEEGILVKWNTLGATFGAKIELHRVDTTTDEDIVVATDLQPAGPGNPPFLPYQAVDKTDLVPGQLYAYYVVGSFDIVHQGMMQTIVSESTWHEVRGALPVSKDRLLSAATPNPFNQTIWTSINVPPTTAEINGTSVPAATAVQVVVYDVAGRRVATLIDDAVFGNVLTVGWDGTNRNGERMPSGVYFLKAAAGPQTDTRKIVLVR